MVPMGEEVGRSSHTPNGEQGNQVVPARRVCNTLWEAHSGVGSVGWVKEVCSVSTAAPPGK